MKIPVALGKDSYDITLERGALEKAGEIFNLDRKVMIVTDSGVPGIYVETVARQCRKPVTAVIEAGEESKNLGSFKMLCETMLGEGFSRKDCVVAAGGGVTGDLAGFAAACYMRGIDFYNVPTTLLAQVDSSVGGKTAVDFCGIKNIIGAFHQPKAVIIDPDVLSTLNEEQTACGAAEIIKIAATFDSGLFERIEERGIANMLEEAIAGALKIKAAVVAEDEKESGVRRALNFGHTIGHGIESVTGRLHGQCVALGMLPMTEKSLRPRMIKILEKHGLPVNCDASADEVMEAVMHDKKADGNSIVTVQTEKIGSHKFIKMDKEELLKAYTEVFG